MKQTALLKTAASLAKQAAEKRRPRADNTPKRARDAAAARIEAARLERAAAYCTALADAIDRGAVPEGVADVVKTDGVKSAALRWASTRLNHGYYSIHDTGKWQDKSPVAEAVRQLVELVK